MKRILVLGFVVAWLVSAVGVSAAPPPHQVTVTMSATVTRVWDANSCCAVERVFEGSTAVPSLGYFTFDGTLDVIVHYVEPSPQHNTLLNMTLVAPNGDTFTIQATSAWYDGDVPPPAPWSIVSGTGRLAAATGSGTYTVIGLDSLSTTVLRLTFVGTVARAGG